MSNFRLQMGGPQTSRWCHGGIYTWSQLFNNEELIKNMTLVTLKYQQYQPQKSSLAGVVLHCFNAKGKSWPVDIQHLYF